MSLNDNDFSADTDEFDRLVEVCLPDASTSFHKAHDDISNFIADEIKHSEELLLRIDSWVVVKGSMRVDGWRSCSK